MKILQVFLVVILGLTVDAAAQSGRRIANTAPVPASTPQVSVTQDAETIKEQDAVGYSESAPNAPRSIYASPSRQKENDKNDKKEKKDKKNKKDKNSDQQTPAPNQQTADGAAPIAGADGGDDEIIKVETQLITIPVSVYNRNGSYIPNLQEKDFKIFENGQEQEIAYFGTSEKPFTVILLIDVSPSTAYKIEEIQDAASAFVEQLKPQDNVMVIEFDNSVHVLSEATNDREKINKAIRRTGFGDGTALYEAVDFSINKRLDKIDGRKAIVLFTDGVDTSSMRATFESTVGQAEESESMIFPIYYNTFLANRGIGTGGVMSVPPIIGSPYPGGGGMGGGIGNGTSSAEYTRGRAYLNELAAATGGRVFRPDSTPGGLTDAFEGIAEELRRQYNIGYYPKNEGTAGERKQIKVRVERPKLVIRSRDSYIVGAK